MTKYAATKRAVLDIDCGAKSFKNDSGLYNIQRSNGEIINALYTTGIGGAWRLALSELKEKHERAGAPTPDHSRGHAHSPARDDACETLWKRAGR